MCARLLIDIRRPWPRRGGAWDHGRCAAWAVAPPGQLWHASRPCKLFLLGFETATWHALGTFKGLKSSKLSAAAVEGSSIRHHGTPLGPTNSFYWASKLLRGTSKLLRGTFSGLKILRCSFRSTCFCWLPNC